MSIPKIIHVSWKSKDILRNDLPFVENGIKKLSKLNPNWELQLSDDEDVEQYLFDNLDHDDYMLLKDRPIVEKLDVWRLIKLYKTGGLYTDIDRLFNVSLDMVLPSKIRCVLPTCLDYDFTHDFMLSSPDNPIYATALNLNLQRRRGGCANIYFLGAQTYMHAVSYCLVGEQINSNPDLKIFTKLRQKILLSSFMATYREHPPYNTFLFRNETVDKITYEKSKQEFYHSYGLKHWTGEW